jgi:hypothetical protein
MSWGGKFGAWDPHHVQATQEEIKRQRVVAGAPQAPDAPPRRERVPPAEPPPPAPVRPRDPPPAEAKPPQEAIPIATKDGGVAAPAPRPSVIVSDPSRLLGAVLEKASEGIRPDVLLRLPGKRDPDARTFTDLCGLGYVFVRREPDDGMLWIPVRVEVVLLCCNRESRTMAILSDLRKCKRSWSDVRIYDDGSSYDLGPAKELARSFGASWTDLPGGPHGKRRFWQVWTQIMRELPPTKRSRLFCLLPEDVRLCRRFFARLLEAWNRRPEGRRGPYGCGINIHIEPTREKLQMWGAPPAERINDSLWKVGWVDGTFLTNGKLFDLVGRAIPEPPAKLWKERPHTGSGVWEHVSRTARAAGESIYRVTRSLVFHTGLPSIMHGELRLRQPLVTSRFIDGAGADATTGGREPIHASLATIPSRAKNLPGVVESLLSQVDVVRVYLNGYTDVPSFLRQKRIVVARSQDHGNIGDAGKFFWCEEASGYELHCDDDFIYPKDHAARLIEAIERYGRKAAVAVHGCRFKLPFRTYRRSRVPWRWNEELLVDEPCHMLGTGTVGYHASAVQLCRADFIKPNMGDVWFALACASQGVPRVVIAHKPNCLEYIEPPWALADSPDRRYFKTQDEALSGGVWGAATLPRSTMDGATSAAQPAFSPIARAVVAPSVATREPIHVSIASIPNRSHILPRTVESLLSQVDVVRVYLNGYTDVPDCLRHERIVVARSQDHGDLGAAGKFFWCEEASGYELHCDDDFIYPKDHAARLVEAIERYGRKAAVSLHGSVIVSPVLSYFRSRVLYHWNQEQEHDVPVHVLGTGVLGYHSSTISICRRDFREPNMADIGFGSVCAVQGVFRVVLAHRKGAGLAYVPPPSTIYDSSFRRDERQTEAVNQIVWLEPKLPPRMS